jgi:hypothetical protein
MGDPRFIAQLGGLLFLNDEFSEAQSVFAESRRRELPFFEVNRIEFTPVDAGGGPLMLEGEVTAVRPGFAFVRTPGYPDFFCPGSKYGDIDGSWEEDSVPTGLQCARRGGDQPRAGHLISGLRSN